MLLAIYPHPKSICVVTWVNVKNEQTVRPLACSAWKKRHIYFTCVSSCGFCFVLFVLICFFLTVPTSYPHYATVPVMHWIAVIRGWVEREDEDSTAEHSPPAAKMETQVGFPSPAVTSGGDLHEHIGPERRSWNCGRSKIYFHYILQSASRGTYATWWNWQLTIFCLGHVIFNTRMINIIIKLVGHFSPT